MLNCKVRTRKHWRGQCHPAGMLEGTGAVHVRMYLEALASFMSGTEVEFRRFSFPSSSLDSSGETGSGN